MSQMVGPTRRPPLTPSHTNTNGHESKSSKFVHNEDKDLDGGYYLHKHKLGEGKCESLSVV